MQHPSYLQKITTELAINWNIDPLKPTRVFQQVGDEEQIVNSIISPAISEPTLMGGGRTLPLINIAPPNSQAASPAFISCCASRLTIQQFGDQPPDSSVDREKSSESSSQAPRIYQWGRFLQF